jgi:hypothetical protein
MQSRRFWVDEAAFVFTTLVLHTLLKLWVASEATRRFSLDRRSGALELVLCTPLKVPEIVGGQLAALWRQFAGPSAVVLLVDLVFAITKRSADEFVTSYVVLVVVFVADMITLSWLGMWLGLRSRNPNRATAGAVVRVMVLPWVIFVAFLFLEINRVLPSEEWTIFFVALAIALGVDLFFLLRARAGLLHHFREVAAQKGK